jgi:drug/metabolite transporter (DMT)-like permease
MSNLRGIILMILAMAFFALGDMLIKWAALVMPVAQIMAIMGAGGALAFVAITRASGVAPLAGDFFNPAILLRNSCEIIGTLTMMTALARVDLAVVAAILQATPLAVTMGAAVFLREQVGWHRWSATIIGFVGVLIIVRPGSSSFSPEIIWPVVAMLFLGMRDLATRLAPAGVPTLRISTYGMFMLFPAGLALMAAGQTPVEMNSATWVIMFFAVVVGVLGYYAITAAMRAGEVSVVSPFRYSRMLFALIIAVTVFGERPDFWTLFGTTITVVAGVYIFMRERRLRRLNALPSPRARV